MTARLHIYLLLIVTVSCNSGHDSVPPAHARVPEIHARVMVLPLGDELRDQFVKQSFDSIKERLLTAELMPPKPMPASAYLASRHRYRADSLIRWLYAQAPPGQIILGITNLDISTTKDSVLDWGVMGLGYRPGQACIASDFRLKNKRNFWKIALHELGHTAGLPHCPVATCLMRDAEGRDHTSEMLDFCASCRKRLEEKGLIRSFAP